MTDKIAVDFGTIVGGGVVSYVSIIGDIENWLGFVLLVCTLILTLIRIGVAVNEWRNKNNV